MRFAGANVLVVPPFECAWMIGDQARFSEPGKVCVAFEAMTENDVTVVFKELAGSKHYRTDTGPSYTLILGSHCNRRLKIEADGRTVVDVASVTLDSTQFEHYWINILNGVITVGKGDPGHGVIYQWIDSKPNCAVQYVGLSSWDKHVVYRNIQVLPPLRPGNIRRRHDTGGFAQYLETEDLADMQIIVASDSRIVPVHKMLLSLCCSKSFDNSKSDGGVLHIPLVEYRTLHALLQYIYTGHTRVQQSELCDLRDLASDFGLAALVSQCDDLKTMTGRTIYDIWASARSSHRLDFKTTRNAEKAEAGSFLSQLPIDMEKLSKLLDDSRYADVEIFVEGHEEAIRAHRLLLSAWSTPFAKMFTNGMRESKTDAVLLKDAGYEPLLAMITFMYKGCLELDLVENLGSILLPLLILADQYGLELLQNICIDIVMEAVNKDSVCTVLQVVASMPTCQGVCNLCEEICAKHFDFCTTLPAVEFQSLQASSVQKILQHPELRVSSEENVLNATILWAAREREGRTWQEAETCLKHHDQNDFFSDRLEDLGNLLPNIRFPLMSRATLEQLKFTSLARSIPALAELVQEALEYLGHGSDLISSMSDGTAATENVHGNLVKFPRGSMRFSPRPSAYKELQYICDGDCNGVIHHIGTSYGRHHWINPVVAKTLVITASSPPTRFTNVKALVSRTYQGTSFAGPCVINGQMSSWWKVDLGDRHQLMCNYYTVRQDGSSNFMRSWSLQGSCDEDNWTELSTHLNDQTLCKAGQFASWPVHGPPSNLPFRYFRVILKKPTTSATNRWNLSICFLEFYGYFQ